MDITSLHLPPPSFSTMLYKTFLTNANRGSGQLAVILLVTRGGTVCPGQP